MNRQSSTRHSISRATPFRRQSMAVALRPRLSFTPCPVCRNLERIGNNVSSSSPARRGSGGEKRVVAFDLEPSALERMAGSRCATCALLYSGIAHVAAMSVGLARVKMASVWWGEGNADDGMGGAGTLEVELYLPDIGSKVGLEFFVSPGTSSPWKAIKPLPRVPTQGSDESVVWVARSLNHCIQNHTKCRSGRSSLPKRVLYVGDLDKPNGLRLFQTNRKLGRYACLSHCWGRTPTTTTTTENIAAHLKGIDLASLPKTFQDAIQLTRKLKIRYLWIDSLCILQDDKNDWLEESTNMASVFSNSLITIAATGASDDNDGCFPATSLLSYGDFSLKTPTRPHDIYVREKLPHWDTIGAESMASTYPLFSRAWAYQERLLPSRVLHFCQRELVWECMEESFCQCSTFKPKSQPKQEHTTSLQEILGSRSTVDAADEEIANPDMSQRRESRLPSVQNSPSPQQAQQLSQRGNRASLVLSGMFSRQNMSSPQVSPPSTEPTEQELFEQMSMMEAKKLTRDLEKQRSLALLKSAWHSTVKAYTQLSLSVPTDRLPAIAGLAQETKACRTGAYLAGLWADTLVEDLLWQVDRLDSHRTGVRPNTQVPTWSWASILAGVTYNGRGWNPDASLRIIESSCVPVAGSRDAYGEVSGGHLTLQGTLRNSNLVYGYSANEDPIYYRLATASGVVDFKADYCLSRDDAPKDRIADHEKVYLLKMARNHSAVVWLVLRRVGKTRIFERIGIIECLLAGVRGTPLVGAGVSAGTGMGVGAGAGDIFNVDEEFGRRMARITIQ